MNVRETHFTKARKVASCTFLLCWSKSVYSTIVKASICGSVIEETRNGCGTSCHCKRMRMESETKNTDQRTKKRKRRCIYLCFLSHTKIVLGRMFNRMGGIY